jgi:integrase
MTTRQVRKHQVQSFPAPAPLATVTDLTPKEVQAITEAVNPLIADAFALYIKTKNFHWHVAGSHFRDYHLLFKAFGADRERALVPRFQTLPWIPSDKQWRAFLTVVKQARLRTRCMAALAYDAGLRCEELCSLHSSDLDPAHRMVRVRAEVAKGSRERVIPYNEIFQNAFSRL